MNSPIPTLKPAVFAAALLALCANVRSADTPITLKDAFKDHFLVGTAVNRGIVTGTSTRRSPELLSQDIALVKQQFNQLVAENDMKWALIHPRPGPDGYHFEPADALVDFGLRNHMELAGHTLVWHSQTPNWVFAGTNPPPTQADAAPSGPGRGPGRYTGPRASREEWLERMREHIHTVVGRYKGKVKVWDVVNEAISDGGPDILRNTLWLEIIGPDYIAKAFEYAHEADPDAILRYNDYGLENPAKRRKLIALVKELQGQKVPVMAIGSQAHVNLSIDFDIMDQALTADEDSDLLDPKSWTKAQQPVFRSTESTGQYGPGHNSFTTSPDGMTDVLIYHSRSFKEIPGGNALANPDRATRAQVLQWNPDGTPDFGVPVADGPYRAPDLPN